jgi:hypothetical protein
MTELFAGDRLEHPALSRAALPDGRIVFAVGADFDREAALVFGRLVRRDLLEARGAGRPVSFLLDLEHAGYLDSRVLDALKRTTAFVLSEPGTRFEFANANEDLKEHLNRVGFGRLFGGLETKPPRRTPELEL